MQSLVKPKLSGTNGLAKETTKSSSSRHVAPGVRSLTPQVDSIHDTTREDLLVVLNTGTHPSALPDLSKRKLIEKKKIYYFSVEKGDSFSLDIKKPETDISVEMLQRFTSLSFIPF